MSRLISRFPHGDARGFGLVEVLTTIMLVGIIGGIAATNFVAMLPAYRVRGAALEIAGDMNQARLAALKEARRYYYVPLAGTQYQIQFDAAGGGLSTLKTVDVAADYPNVTFSATGIPNDPYGTASPPAVPAAAITFNSDGTVTNPAGVYILGTEADSHARHTVTVTGAGRIRVWHYDGSTWR